MFWLRNKEISFPFALLFGGLPKTIPIQHNGGSNTHCMNQEQQNQNQRVLEPTAAKPMGVVVKTQILFNSHRCFLSYAMYHHKENEKQFLAKSY